METESTSANKPRRGRRWLQFSLRSLLALTTVAAVLLGWYAFHARCAQRQQEAVEAIHFLGGIVVYEHEDDGRGTSFVRIPPGPQWGRKWFGVDFYRHVKIVSLIGAGVPKDGRDAPGFQQIVDEYVRGRQLTKQQLAEFKFVLRAQPRTSWDVSRFSLTDKDLATVAANLAGLSCLKELKLGRNEAITLEECPEIGSLVQLEKLYLWGTGLTDRGSQHLAGLERLKELNVAWTKITDATMPAIGKLTALETLYLTGSKITDRGVLQLSALSELRKLSLNITGVTDAGIAHLRGLHNLQRLNLAHTQVTDEGVAKLSSLTNLTWLNLHGTQMTGKGLEHLAALTNLRHLDVRQTDVTEADVMSLQEKLPHASIKY